ncbi:hypothetical protein HanRHA438_Chr10g0453921 [Helianthus annuus]|nr:hypothetical protein HanRHA438_Chr10g0453921 [Helianthus annuus]
MQIRTINSFNFNNNRKIHHGINKNSNVNYNINTNQKKKNLPAPLLKEQTIAFDMDLE